MHCIGLACGGEPGSRLAERLGIPVSADTMLREIRRTPISCSSVPRAVGVDDWAFCKGRRYGTLICDLETGRVLDLLPDRDAKSLATWLQGFKSVEIVSRDRGDIYRKGARKGAPGAIQVADRFHLMKNLRVAFARFLEGQALRIQEALEGEEAVKNCEGVPEGNLEQTNYPSNPCVTSKVHERKAENRKRRFAKYNRVIELHRQGESARSIAAELGIHRGTVAKYLQADAFPERACRSYFSNAAPCANYLWERWHSGCNKVSVLWREVTEHGFTVSYHSVRRFVSSWRKMNVASCHTASNRRVTLSPNEASWLLFKKQANLCDQEVRWKRAILAHCGEVRAAWQVTRRFIVMLRKRKGKHLARWFAMATKADIPHPIRQFAKGLKNDWAAVTAALTLSWNNGAAEGHISKLKMIKRQMYGRAKFDLLRARLLAKQ
jgi:transposase